MHLLPDETLVERAQAGDRSAFEQLIARYQPLLRHIAWRMVGQPDLIDDLLQEATLQAYLSLRHVREAGKVRAWLGGIVANICNSFLRDQRSIPLSLDALAGKVAGDTLLVATAPDPHQRAEQRELQAHLWAAVQALSPKRRAVTVLFYYHQYTIAEIASLLGMSVGTVKVHLHGARKWLRQQLTSQEPAVLRGTDSTERQPMIAVTIADVVELRGQERCACAVALFDAVGQRILPIWIGQHEAYAIARTLRNVTMPRPMTLDFVGAMLGAASASLAGVHVSAVREKTYYALVRVRQGATMREVDARPSDALGLAALLGGPITVDAAILDEHGVAVPPEQRAQLGRGLEQLMATLEAESQAVVAHISGEDVQRARQELHAALFGD